MDTNRVRDPQEATPFDWTYKGLSPDWVGMTAAQIAATETALFQSKIMFPTAVLRRSVMDANRAWMRKFLKLTGVHLAPHGKTSLAPALFRKQIDDGAWAMTAATAYHLRLYRKFGVQRIFMANQLVGDANVDWIAAELQRDTGFEFFCLVDSVCGVELLAERMKATGLDRPLCVLIEVGTPGGRCGVRSVPEALEVAAAIVRRSPQLALVGVETFEGLAHFAPDGVDLAETMIDKTISVAQACMERGFFSEHKILLSAGGSSFFDLAAKMGLGSGLGDRVEVILRSGCYITHDDGGYGRTFEALCKRSPEVKGFGEGLHGALQVWAEIQSLPEPGQLVCAIGRRDVGTETDMPKPIAWARPGALHASPAPQGLKVTSIFDQHAVLAGPQSHGLEIGDLIGFGVSHPCTTFDKWRAVLLVDDDYVVRDVIRTYF